MCAVADDEDLTVRQRQRAAHLARMRLRMFNRSGATHKHPDRAPLLARYEELETAYHQARVARAPGAEVRRLMAECDAALLRAKESGIQIRDLGVGEEKAARILKRARAARAEASGAARRT